MLRKVLILGAGSIGNHYANASSELKLKTSVFDINIEALKRMKEEIFPARYGSWNQNIELLQDIPKNIDNETLVILGTPPDVRKSLIHDCVNKGAEHILIEKPLSSPGEDLSFINEILNQNISLYSGYNHPCSKAYASFKKLFDSQTINPNDIEEINVNWLESWDGPLSAHFWMNSVFDSYLGYSEKGGGAMSEHSHGLNMGITFAKDMNIDFEFESVHLKWDHSNSYDELFRCKLLNAMQKRMTIVQDAVTAPAIKKLEVVGKDFTASVEFSSSKDLICILQNNKEQKTEFIKSRAEDFINNLDMITSNYKRAKDLFNNAIETQLIINECWKNK